MLEIVTRILNEVLLLDGSEINEDVDLIELGLDSLKAIELVVELEEEFDIMVDEDDLLIENMNTLNKIIKLVLKYKGASCIL